MRRQKLTISVAAQQADLLRRSTAGPRKIGARIGNIEEMLWRDWNNAVLQLEAAGWTRAQILQEARAIAIWCLAPYGQVQHNMSHLPFPTSLYVWQIARELQMCNAAVETHLQDAA